MKKGTSTKKKASTKKKVSKKKAKRVDPDSGKSVPDGQLGDWGDDVPQAVQEAADLYEEALLACNRMREARDAKKDSLIFQMKKHDVERVRIRNGEKIITLTDEPKVKVGKAKKKKDEDDG